MRRWLILWVLGLAFAVLAWTFLGAGGVSGGGERQEALARRLAYLEQLPEVSWVEVERNNVYIGFKRLPSDLRLIVNAAAYHGNREIDSGVHVWAIRGEYVGWRPGSREPGFICEVTARYGKIQDSSC